MEQPGPKLEFDRMRSAVRPKLFGKREDPIKIDRYSVLHRLGGGGMGVVYAAYDPELDRKIAVKLLRPDAYQGEGSETVRTRLLREAQAIAKIAHPNVIAVHDTGTYDGNVYIAMEMVNGDTLARWLAESERGIAEIVEVFVQAGRGLMAAHEAGLVHRDFKPDNVLVGRDKRVRVVDFGLAKPQSETLASESLVNARRGEVTEDEEDPRGLLESPITRTGAVMGTPAYMAPEQHEGGETDDRTDQYSFCVALYEALCGHRPFSGKRRADLHRAKAAGKIREPAGGTRLPTWLRKVVWRGLQPLPEDRFRTMAELLTTLERDRRRWRVWLSAAVASVIGLSAVGYALGDTKDRPCDPASDPWEQTWNAQRQASVRGAFEQTGQPYAEGAWKETERALGRYGERWQSLFVAACEAARVDDDPTDALLRLQCLEGRRLEADTLIGLLEGDDPAVQHAARGVRLLRHVESCASAKAVRTAVQIPSDPQTRTEVQRLRIDLLKMRLEAQTGNREQADEAMARIIVEAKALGYQPLVADALMSAGISAQHNARFDEAVALLEEAADVAKACQYPWLEANAWIQLSQVLGLNLARYDEGLRWARRAEAAIAGVGGDPYLTGKHQQAMGGLYLGKGDYGRARDSFRDALATAEAIDDGDELRFTRIHHSLSISERRLGNYEEALGHAKLALEGSLKVYGAHHPSVAISYVEIANVHAYLGNLEDAIDGYERSVAIYEAALGPNHQRVGEALGNLGSILNSAEQAQRAQPILQRARAIYERVYGPDHPEMATVVTNLGDTQRNLGNEDKALVLYAQALKIREKSLGENHPKLHNTLQSMGSTHLAVDNTAEAIAAYERAHRIIVNSLGDDHPELFGALSGLGRSALADGDPKRAIELLEQAIALAQRHSLSSRQLTWGRYSLARALWEDGQHDRALELANRVRAAYAEAGTLERLEMVDAWLAEHPAK